MQTFTFYDFWYQAMRKMTREQQGALIMALCRYAFDGVKTKFTGDPILDMVLSLMCLQLDAPPEEW